MVKTNTNLTKPAHIGPESMPLTNSAIELVNWSVPSSILSPAIFSALATVNEKVFALQTTRLSFSSTLPLTGCEQVLTPLSLNDEQRKNEDSSGEKTPFGCFNLGLHVGDLAEKVNHNRNQLTEYIAQELVISSVNENSKLAESLDIQWLEQVHGKQVVDVTSVSSHAITADASITRQKNIALAIMTADCLPILLSHKKGKEVAAIHGGWRPLAANIIEETIIKMHSEPAELVAWLGPCIGHEAFEVGLEVKEAFTQKSNIFETAFVKQVSGKYLADLHKIAEIQLQSLGVRVISTLAECTYQRTDKYYSYRKEQVTGRMASVICRR